MIHRLRGVLLEAGYSGLIWANEIFQDWLLGRISMPLGKDGEHITIHLLDFDTPQNNHFVVSQQALTEIFLELRNGTTPQIIANVVEDIDKIVRATRFDGWQSTHAGQKEIQKVLWQTLFKYKLHKEQELFEKAYGYIREHY